MASPHGSQMLSLARRWIAYALQLDLAWLLEKVGERIVAFNYHSTARRAARGGEDMELRSREKRGTLRGVIKSAAGNVVKAARKEVKDASELKQGISAHPYPTAK